MSNWAITFLVFAIIAGGLALTGVVGLASDAAQSVCMIFLFLFLAAMVARTFHDDPPNKTGTG